MANIYARDIDDSDGLQLVSLRIPGKARSIIHRSRPAQCLAWLLMSKNMGDYRAWRRTAGCLDDGGYIKDFIKEGILTVKKAPKRKS
jgi:hypothetical protein